MNDLDSSSFDRKKHNWMSDHEVDNCCHCNSIFGTFNRRRHCRACGKIFCSSCIKYARIPEGISHGFSNTNNTFDIFKSYIMNTKIEEQKVCLICYDKIIRYNKANNLINVFKILKLDIYHLKKLSNVSQFWKDASDIILLEFKRIQYKLPGELCDESEKKLLWANVNYLSGHNKYMYYLLTTSNTENELSKFISVNISEKKVSCSDLHCNKMCKKRFTPFDGINMLYHMYTCNVPDKNKFEQIISGCFENCSSKEFKCYIQFIVYYIKNDGNTILHDFLINKCIDDIELCNYLYWELKLNSVGGNKIFPLWNKFKVALSNNELMNKKICSGELFVKLFMELYSSPTISQNIINMCDSFGTNDKILPIKPIFCIGKILLNDLKIIESATKPMILPLKCINGYTYKIMYKKENLRPDQIVMNIINLMVIIIKTNLGINFNVVSYNVLPIDNSSGLIEIVDNCETIFHINSSNFSILNYILEYNDDCSIKCVRDKFIKSTAFFSIITYLLGVGDRHLHNIMVKKDGQLFHIDYGYILGDDTMFNEPGIKINYDIIDALGGTNSKYYEEFENLCVDIYNLLRSNIDIFMQLIMLLTKLTNINKDDKSVKDEIYKRFLPGENDIRAKKHILEKIREDNFANKIKDWTHSIAHEGTLSNALSGTKNIFSGLFS